jgi:hypothetical protein
VKRRRVRGAEGRLGKVGVRVRGREGVSEGRVGELTRVARCVYGHDYGKGLRKRTDVMLDAGCWMKHDVLLRKCVGFG